MADLLQRHCRIGQKQRKNVKQTIPIKSTSLCHLFLRKHIPVTASSLPTQLFSILNPKKFDGFPNAWNMEYMLVCHLYSVQAAAICTQHSSVVHHHHSAIYRIYMYNGIPSYISTIRKKIKLYRKL